jgi:hypothetical protein
MAQSFMLSASGEKTVKGTDYGLSLGYETKRSWSLGSFYQSRIQSSGEKEGVGLLDPFY